MALHLNLKKTSKNTGEQSTVTSLMKSCLPVCLSVGACDTLLGLGHVCFEVSSTRQCLQMCPPVGIQLEHRLHIVGYLKIKAWTHFLFYSQTCLKKFPDFKFFSGNSKYRKWRVECNTFIQSFSCKFI